MKYRGHRAPVWAIWGLIGAFALIEAAAWTIAGGIPRRPAALIQGISGWVGMLILASLATRRLQSQAQRIKAPKHTHHETPGETEPLPTQNAMLELYSASSCA